MRSQQQFRPQDIRSDRRFDVLVKKEMEEHNHLISSHNKEMQSLREEFRLSLDKCQSLSEKTNKEISELREGGEKNILILKDKARQQELTIADQKKTIESLHDQLNSFHKSQASKEDLEKFKRDMQFYVKDSTMTNIDAFQNCQKEFKKLFSEIQNDLLKLSLDITQKISDVMVKSDENFCQARLDKEGIERELVRYKKSVFYIEKKIENIYTLIERIKKIG